MKKSIGVSIFLIMMLVMGFNLPAFAEAPIKPGGPFVPPSQDVNISAIMTFDEVEAELLKMEKRSKGLLEVDTAGYTQENRPLYIAKMGWGPVRMWIQGRIHGGEPFGNEEEGRSQVVSMDVRDTVQAIMPSLMRIFHGSDRTVEYVPQSAEDVASAKQAPGAQGRRFDADPPPAKRPARPPRRPLAPGVGGTCPGRPGPGGSPC